MQELNGHFVNGKLKIKDSEDRDGQLHLQKFYLQDFEY